MGNSRVRTTSQAMKAPVRRIKVGWLADSFWSNSRRVTVVFGLMSLFPSQIWLLCLKREPSGFLVVFSDYKVGSLGEGIDASACAWDCDFEAGLFEFFYILSIISSSETKSRLRSSCQMGSSFSLGKSASLGDGIVSDMNLRWVFVFCILIFLNGWLFLYSIESYSTESMRRIVVVFLNLLLSSSSNKLLLFFCY